MKKRNPEKTIDQLFEEFLADQKATVSPRTWTKYNNAIDLYRSYLESYWPDHSMEEYNAITDLDGTYCGTFGAKEMASGFAEFLDYFMPHKVIAGNDTMKAAGTVIKKLSKWLVEKGLIEDDELLSEQLNETARDLPASQKLLDRLEDWLAENAPVDSANRIEGHFTIQRIEPRQIWLAPVLSAGRQHLPVPVPAAIAKACKVGWDIGGAVAETAKGWRLVEVWNLSP
jgi:hypothetical protein